ncbi:hypothetical protein VYU27_010132 [Nannochloropsis oceanica]
MATRGILMLLVACVCGSVQGQLSARKKIASGSSKAGVAEAWDQMGEQVKANAEAVKAAMPGLLDPVGSTSKLAFFQAVKKAGGVDAIELFDTVIKSKAFEKILENVEVQHRLMEEIPILGAIPGFLEVKGRRLSDEETKAGFRKGMQNMWNMMKTVAEHAKDPTLMNTKLVELSKSDDPEILALFKAAGENDEASIMELQNMVAADLYPGVDVSVMRDILDAQSFDKILSFPELSRFVDQDPYLAKVLRTPK